jgi:hypothetical protein
MPRITGLAAILAGENVDYPDYDLNDVVGMSGLRRTALFENNGFTMIRAIGADKRVGSLTGGRSGPVSLSDRDARRPVRLRPGRSVQAVGIRPVWRFEPTPCG